MALKEPLMVKYVEVTNATSVSLLTPKIGEGYKVKSLQLTADVTDAPRTPAFCKIKIDMTTIGYYRVGSTEGNHLRWERRSSAVGSLFTYLVKNNIFPPIPLQQGETLILEFSQAYTGGILVEYEIYDAGDVSNTAPLGSKSNELYYVLYGTNGSEIATSGYFELTAVRNPVEFPQAPFGDKVLPNQTLEIVACLAQDVGRFDTSSRSIVTTGLRFILNNQELFSDLGSGFLLKGTAPTSAGYNYGTGISYFNPHKYGDVSSVKLFPQSLKLQPFDELKVLIGVDASGGSSFPPNAIDVPLIVHLKRGG
jgi:hypothetical protein